MILEHKKRSGKETVNNQPKNNEQNGNSPWLSIFTWKINRYFPIKR